MSSCWSHSGLSSITILSCQQSQIVNSNDLDTVLISVAPSNASLLGCFGATVSGASCSISSMDIYNTGQTCTTVSNWLSITTYTQNNMTQTSITSGSITSVTTLASFTFYRTHVSTTTAMQCCTGGLQGPFWCGPNYCPADPQGLCKSSVFVPTQCPRPGRFELVSSVCYHGVGGCPTGGLNACCSGITCGQYANYSPRELAQMSYSDPNDVGCTSWDKCDFATVSTFQEGTVFAPGPGCNDMWPYRTYVNLRKTVYDDTYLEPCCTGSISDTLKCDPSWCPSDPTGQCAVIAQQRCSSKSDICDKQAMLVLPMLTVTDASSTFCPLWYYSVRDNPGHPAKNTLSLMISQWCDGPGASNGECACYNFMNSVNAASGSSAILQPSAVNDSTFNRIDLYCQPGGSNTHALHWLSPDTAQRYCGFHGDSGTSISSQPLNPVAGLTSMPAHCWLADCQQSRDTCLFWDDLENDEPCPDICMQISSGNNVTIDSMSVSNNIIINSMVERCSFPGSVATSLGTAFAIENDSSTPQLEICIQTQSVLVTSITLNNMASETHWPAAAQIPFAVHTSLGPMVKILQPQGVATLTNAGSYSVVIQVDSTDELQGPYNGEVSIVDQTGGNLTLHMPLTVQVSSQCSGSGGGTSRIITSSSSTSLQLKTPPSTSSSTSLQLKTPPSTSSSTLTTSSWGILWIVCAVLLLGLILWLAWNAWVHKDHDALIIDQQTPETHD